jgi:Protein of unknown function (DUF1552)
MNPHANPSAALSRRRFLRNVGVCMALPAFESFIPRGFAAAAASGPRLAGTTATGAPLRTAFLYFPNGAIPAAWWPTGANQEFELNRTLKPLANVKDKIQVVGGLTDLSAVGGADGGGDHARANGTFLTGVRIAKSGGSDFRAGVSADQIMAQQIGLLTPFRSLELSCDSIQNAGTCDTGYSCVYQHNLSWSGPTSPMTPEIDPRLLFERLFGAGARNERQKNLLVRQQQQRSILDFIMDDSRELQRQISGRDRFKLDEYLTSVRDIEVRIQQAEQSRANRPQPDVDAPGGIPNTTTEYVRLMFDMLHLAFQTDSTRVATFMLGSEGSDRTYPELGIADGHHFLTHHNNKAEYVEKVTQIDTWYASQLGYFLDKMDQTKDIDGKSLLDNSQIVYGSGNADGNRHSHDNLPVILAGGGGGTLTPGRYVQHSPAPVTNLFLSMMERIGGAQVPERFGDSTGRLANI